MQILIPLTSVDLHIYFHVPIDGDSRDQRGSWLVAVLQIKIKFPSERSVSKAFQVTHEASVFDTIIILM